MKKVTFTVVTGDEPYKVIDLSNGGESFFETKIEAYQFMSILARLGRNYRLEIRN